MAKTKSEFKGKEGKDLIKLLKDKQEALRMFGVEVLGGKEKNVKKGRSLRKDIARIMTELTVQSRELAQ